MYRKSRQEIIELFQERSEKGKILAGVGTGMEQTAKHSDHTGADFLVFYHTGRLQRAGRSMLAGMLSYDDANTIVQELGDEVLSSVRKTPVFVGVCGTDPFRNMDMFLRQLKEQGFNGVQNFPTVGIVDGRFRANMEGTDIGYRLEVDMIRTANEMDLFTCPLVFDAEQAEAMTLAGADMLILHFGLVTKSAIERGVVPSIDSCQEKMKQILERCRNVRPNILLCCCGQQVDCLEGAAQLLQNISDINGFFSFFPEKNETTEKGLSTHIKEYHTLNRIKRSAVRGWREYK